MALGIPYRPHFGQEVQRINPRTGKRAVGFVIATHVSDRDGRALCETVTLRMRSKRLEEAALRDLAPMPTVSATDKGWVIPSKWPVAP